MFSLFRHTLPFGVFTSPIMLLSKVDLPTPFLPRRHVTIRRLAQIYLCKNRINDLKVRFDVVEVYMEKKGDDIEVKEISLIKNAF